MSYERWRRHRSYVDMRLGLKRPDDFDEEGFGG